VPDAEHYAGEVLDWDSPAELDDAILFRFGELVAAHARPIDDVRSTADYRRQAIAVLARRTLRWTWDDYRRGVA
jgi:CO/xanthine dehydrogenase FAD-binding subunit